MDVVRRFKLTAALFVVLFVMAPTARAMTYELGTLSGEQASLGTVAVGNFEDTWNFTVDGPSDVAIQLSSVEVNGQFISWSIVNLIANVDSFTADLSNGFLFSSLNGNYKIKVKGEGVGDNGGGYVIRTDVLFTPLPAAAWLFGSALLGLFVVGRNRQMKTSLQS